MVNSRRCETAREPETVSAFQEKSRQRHGRTNNQDGRTVKSVKILVNIFLKDHLSPRNAAITILKHNANGSFELTCTLSLNLRVRSPIEFSYCCSYIFYRSSRERI